MGLLDIFKRQPEKKESGDEQWERITGAKKPGDIAYEKATGAKIVKPEKPKTRSEKLSGAFSDSSKRFQAASKAFTGAENYMATGGPVSSKHINDIMNGNTGNKNRGPINPMDYLGGNTGTKTRGSVNPMDYMSGDMNGPARHTTSHKHKSKKKGKK
jgi:hypothetical protein